MASVIINHNAQFETSPHGPPQAGVDLGTALADHELRRRKKRRGKKSTAEGVGPQLKPKRRQPISQVLLLARQAVEANTRFPASTFPTSLLVH